jgi:hypothetical protein
LFLFLQCFHYFLYLFLSFIHSLIRSFPCDMGYTDYVQLVGCV